MKKKQSAFEYKGLVLIAAVFALIALILFLERSGIQYQYNSISVELMPNERTLPKAEALKASPRDCLVLYTSSYKSSTVAMNEFEVILTDMKVGHDTFDISSTDFPDFAEYKNAIIILSDLSELEESLIRLDEWVRDGGRALFPMVFEKEEFFSVMETKFGIIESSYKNAIVDSIYVTDSFMIGGGRGFEIMDGWDSGLSLQLYNDERVTLYAHTDDERRVPLIWETTYGDGKFVFDNIGNYTKEWRGFYAASYTLLDPVTVYPVINGSCFYLDDFPSQIPSGNNEYVWRDFGTSIKEFYVNIWWPDMMNFSDKYKLKYTGLAIQSYDNNVDGTTYPLSDKRVFLNFGNMLLRKGGEIGYHGYNHQPLCFDNCDYKGIYDYKTWESEEAMKSGIDTLMELCDELFPGVRMTVYVPPSNILSREGQAFLAKQYPNIRSISGTYFVDDDLDFGCVQEFDVEENGVVDQPRIISGCYINPFMQLAAVSELNLHYVNSHFTHPDDALDPDRGAEMGWEKLTEHFDEYLTWLYSSAPNIRNLTGTEMAGAVQRFASLTVSTELDDSSMTVRLGNLYDTAELMVRFNDRKPKDIVGGKLEKLTDTLYLLTAEQAEVKVTFE